MRQTRIFSPDQGGGMQFNGCYLIVCCSPLSRTPSHPHHTLDHTLHTQDKTNGKGSQGTVSNPVAPSVTAEAYVRAGPRSHTHFGKSRSKFQEL